MEEDTGTRRRVLRVQEGVVVPPVLLRRLLPDIASIVKDAMTAGFSKLVQYSTGNPQDTDETCKPQDTGDTSKPQNTENTSKPQDADDKSKLQDANDTLKPQDTDDTCKPRTQKKILNPFPCDICKLRFPSRYTLNTHLLLHEYVCQICKIDFGTKKLLLKHKCWLCKTCNKPCASFDHKNCHKVTQYSCEMCDETFEDSLAATSHSRTHGAPMRSYTRKPKPVNVQQKSVEPVNIVKGQNLSDVPIELDGDTEPQERVNVKDGHEERWPAQVKKERCYKRSNEDLGRDGVTEPKLRCVKVEFDVDEKTRNPNQNIGETLKHLGGVKVEPDLRDEMSNFDVVTYTSTLHEHLRDKDMREAIDKVDVVVTEESSKLFEAVKIEPEVSLEIKKEPNERLELDEVISEKQDVKAYPLGLSTAELYAGHQIVDGIALGPVRVRAPIIYTGKNAMRSGSSKQVQHSTCKPQDTDDTCKPQDSDDTSKPQDTDDTSKSQDAGNTSKSHNTNNKCKLESEISFPKPFPCYICHRQFQSRHHLGTHLSSHEYECRMCEINFGSKKLFLKHKCCVCKICNKPSASFNHNKCPKVFTCKCGEKFTSISDCNTHQKIHVEIYGSCPACNKQFTNSTDLINHVNNMKFPCIYCDSCFPGLEELLAHNIEQPDPPKYSCKLCNETFEDSLSAASHSKTHVVPMRSYTRKQKAVNAQGKRRERVNIVKEQNKSDVPIELDGDLDPQERVNVKDGYEERSCYKTSNECLGRDGVIEPKRKRVKVELDISEETRNPNQKGLYIGDLDPQERVNVKDGYERSCYKASNEDLGRDGVIEPKRKRVKVELDISEETRNPNQKGIYIGETLKHLEGVKVEPDLRDEPNENYDVVTNTFTLHEPLRDKDIREAIDEMDVGTEESSKLFEIENEVRREIKIEPNERLASDGFDEVMDEEQDVKTWPKLSTSELYAGHLIVDGVALGPVRVRAPIVYTGKNALRYNTSAQMLEPGSIKVEPAEIHDEIEALDIKREDV